MRFLKFSALIGDAFPLLILVVLSLLFSSTLQAQKSSLIDQQRTASQAEILNKARASSSGGVPVIVRFKSERKQAETVRGMMLEREKNGARFKTNHQAVRNFKHSNLSSMNVYVDELNGLLQDPDVEVYEDTLKFPLLASSVPAVYSTQNQATFHGNNEWTVAVLDSGIEKTHSFLTNKVVSEGCFSSGGGQAGSNSLCPAGAVSSSAVGSGENCSIVGCEHGTQVAGIAVGNGSSFDGVAKDAQLISIQVYSEFNDEAICGLGATSCIAAYTSDIIAALESVYDLRSAFKIASVNLSLGSSQLFSGSCNDQPEASIISQLKAAGIAVVVATGNSANTSQMQSPACISDAIAVAASSNDGATAWSGNNISDQLDLFAPGIDINSSSLNNDFSIGTGTSLAAPHVAGALAVMKHVNSTLSVDQAELLLKSYGPTLTQHTVTRRRFDLAEVLENLEPFTPTEVDEICFPIKGTNGSVVVVCL